MNFHKKPHKRFTLYDWPEESKKAAKHLAVDLGITLQQLILNAVDKYVQEKQ